MAKSKLISKLCKVGDEFKIVPIESEDPVPLRPKSTVIKRRVKRSEIPESVKKEFAAIREDYRESVRLGLRSSFLPSNERISIKHGDTGHTYESLFGKYLKTGKKVFVVDRYIRNQHQIDNFIRLCRMLISYKMLEEIHLTTSFEDYFNRNRVSEELDNLKFILKKYRVTLSYDFSDEIHDRYISTDNGWVIDIGRGIDIYQPPEKCNDIEVDDFKNRPCYETNINISRQKKMICVPSRRL